MKSEHDKLKRRIEQQAARIKRAESEKDSLFAQSIYVGSLGLLFIVPTVAGAYIGFWLDSMAATYSVGWTVSLLCVGVVVGVLNVWLFIREGE